MARIRAAMRHTAPAESSAVFHNDDLVVDFTRRLVMAGGREIDLTPNEYDILRTLVQHAGTVLTHGELLRTVWGTAYEGESHMLRVNVSNLRRQIEQNPAKPRHIITEPGVGYRLRVSELA